MSANLKTSTFAVLTSAAVFFAPSYAMAQQNTANSAESESMQEISERLAKMETDQAALLENQEKILEELKNLRVWVRRS